MVYNGGMADQPVKAPSVRRWRTEGKSESYGLAVSGADESNLLAICAIYAEGWRFGCNEALRDRDQGDYAAQRSALASWAGDRSPAMKAVLTLGVRHAFQKTWSLTRKDPCEPPPAPEYAALPMRACKFKPGDSALMLGGAFTTLSQPWPLGMRAAAVRVQRFADGWRANILHVPAESKTPKPKAKPRRGSKKAGQKKAVA